MSKSRDCSDDADYTPVAKEVLALRRITRILTMASRLGQTDQRILAMKLDEMARQERVPGTAP